MASRIDGRRGQEKGGMQTDAAPSSVPVLIDRRCRTRQQRQLLTHPCGPQAERHRPGTLVTGEAAVAALLITPAYIEAGVGDAQSVIDTPLERPFQGWAYADADYGNWGQNYAHRAHAAIGRLAALPRHEAMYMLAIAPDGTYHFTKGDCDLPPINCRLSTLVTDCVFATGTILPRRYLLNRYSIGDRTAGLRRIDDGSFDSWISRQNPGGEKTDNWLPAPESGPYSLYMRAYLPKPELLSGDIGCLR
jgi:hypothetical protein